ncbi:MAG: amidohydrolase family protein, partial [Olsenella sp.]|nr:amidohydrolase family protein [Olsenella sp.]
MNENTFAIKGDIVWSRHNHTLSWAKDGYLVVVDGVVQGVYQQLPAEYEGIRIVDHTGKLVIPGMNDIHVHAPQYSFRGMGMDLELLEWLNTHTFPEESKYADLSYAERAYDIFSDDLLHSPTTRAVVFGTMHVEPTELLMDKLEATGLKTYVGKVNMDRNSPDYLCEKDAATSLADTVRWLNDVEAKGYANTKPILTPRFTPTCSDELMEGLGKLKQERNLPLQSHLSENLSEIDWVHGLAPWSTCYGQTYEHFGQLDGEGKTVMAHCNYS